MPTILGANSVSGYEIDNSMRFNDGNANKFQRSPSSGGNRNTFTFSCWVKLSDIGNRSCLLGLNGNNNNEVFQLIIHQDGYLFVSLYNLEIFQTNMVLRDPSAWYHIVLSMDSTEGSSDNRTKLYVNGDRITSFRANNLNSISQNFNFGVGRSGESMSIGATPNGGDPIGGYMSEINFVDGTALGPDKFGKTNDNGVWIPIEPDVSAYGTNGFFLEFKGTGFDVNSSGVGADTSGNDNHHGSTNFATDHITTDTPTNNFATLNPLIPVQQVPVYSEGNTKVVFKDGGNGCSPLSTFAVDSGKFYFEAKFVQTSDPGHGAIGVGIVDADKYNPYGDADDAFDLESFGYSYTTDGNAKTSGNDSSFGDEFNSGDIIGVAVDFDNRQIYYSKNGTFQDSGDPTSGASGTGSAHNFSVGTYYFAVYAYQDENSWEMNFGNPPHSISSSNSDGNGYGSFEYAVPSGYFALCTKNLAEHG